MRFAKYQGTGNDFVMVTDLEDSLELTPELVRSLCDRRFGIGADGVIRVTPSSSAHFFMDYVNADGSPSEMCGNGIRCLAVFARAEGLTTDDVIDVDTRSGVKTVIVAGDRVRVDMGPPIFEPSEIPVTVEGAGSDALHTKLELNDEVFEAATLSMGNPHAVLFVEDASAAPVTTLGPRLEKHAAFPNKANIEFVTIDSPDRITMRVWERGSRETLACGTGACAAAVAARLLRDTDARVTVGLRGGDLEIEWAGSTIDERPVFMTGTAVEVFTGDVRI
ncbi:MAG: diaminopimelate epimerase [Actinomycetota bacterium]